LIEFTMFLGLQQLEIARQKQQVLCFPRNAPPYSNLQSPRPEIFAGPEDSQG